MPSASWCEPRSRKLRPDPATRSTTVRDTSTSPVCAERGDARADVGDQAGRGAGDQIAFAGVQADRERHAGCARGRRADRAGAADRPRRPVEHREHAIAGALHAGCRRTGPLRRDDRLQPIRRTRRPRRRPPATRRRGSSPACGWTRRGVRESAQEPLDLVEHASSGRRRTAGDPGRAARRSARPGIRLAT